MPARRRYVVTAREPENSGAYAAFIRSQPLTLTRAVTDADNPAPAAFHQCTERMADHRVTLNPCGYQRLMQFRCHLGDTVIFFQRVGIIAGAVMAITD